jgi:hypothetical protein
LTKEHHKILAETSGGRYTPEEVQALEQGMAADAADQDFQEVCARAAGYCYHCGEKLDDCTGYKCWIR